MNIDIITISPAHHSDLDEILELLRRSGLPGDGLEDHLSGTLVARDGNRIVGSAALEVYNGAALLRSVAVDKNMQGRGIGVRLTQAAIDMATALNIDSIYLLTETAGQFFPRFGFVLTTRNDVPDIVRQSVEFTTACPDSALVMTWKADGNR